MKKCKDVIMNNCMYCGDLTPNNKFCNGSCRNRYWNPKLKESGKYNTLRYREKQISSHLGEKNGRWKGGMSKIKKYPSQEAYLHSKENVEKLKTIGHEKHKWAFRQHPMLRKENVEKWAKSIQIAPNKKEQFLDSFLQSYFPNEWKFVGDGQVILGHSIPDFINCNGKKQIIELFGDYWHSEKLTGKNNIENELERKKIFSEFGYKTLVIWERELKDVSLLLNKIKEFQEVD